MTVVLEEASLKAGTDPVLKWYNGKRSKMSLSSYEKQKFTAPICIMYYVGCKTDRKKRSPAEYKLNIYIYIDSEIIFVHRTFFYKRSLIIMGTAVLKIVNSL